MSPKVVVYVRAEDARVISSTTEEDIGTWVRQVVADEISSFHERRARSLGAMPAPWMRQEPKEE